MGTVSTTPDRDTIIRIHSEPIHTLMIDRSKAEQRLTMRFAEDQAAIIQQARWTSARRGPDSRWRRLAVRAGSTTLATSLTSAY